MVKIRNIDYVVENSEKVALTNVDIEYLTNKKCNIFLYSDLMELKTIHDVLGPHGAAIILYQTTDRLFGHYACIFKKKGSDNVLEFYDSYGVTMDKELKFSKFNTKNMGGRLVPHLTDMVERSVYRVESNTKSLQKNRRDINTCGRYAALRIIFRELNNKEFNYMIASNKHYDSDYAVSILTMFHSDFINILKKGII